MPIIKDVQIGWDALDMEHMDQAEAIELIHELANKVPMNIMAQALRESYADEADREYMIHRMTMPDEELSKEREQEKGGREESTRFSTTARR